MNNIDLWFLNWNRYEQQQITVEEGRETAETIEKQMSIEEFRLLNAIVDIKN